MGFRDGKSVAALYKDGVVSTTFERPKRPRPLGATECEWLLSDVLPQCAKANGDSGDPCDASAILERMAMYAHRGMYAIEQNPAFNKGRFLKLCETACKRKRVPNRVEFERTACGGSSTRSR
jgi:hypothetical protein